MRYVTYSNKYNMMHFSINVNIFLTTRWLSNYILLLLVCHALGIDFAKFSEFMYIHYEIFGQEQHYCNTKTLILT